MSTIPQRKERDLRPNRPPIIIIALSIILSVPRRMIGSINNKHDKDIRAIPLSSL